MEKVMNDRMKVVLELMSLEVWGMSETKKQWILVWMKNLSILYCDHLTIFFSVWPKSVGVSATALEHGIGLCRCLLPDIYVSILLFYESLLKELSFMGLMIMQGMVLKRLLKQNSRQKISFHKCLWYKKWRAVTMAFWRCDLGIKATQQNWTEKLSYLRIWTCVTRNSKMKICLICFLRVISWMVRYISTYMRWILLVFVTVRRIGLGVSKYRLCK